MADERGYTLLALTVGVCSCGECQDNDYSPGDRMDFPATIPVNRSANCLDCQEGDTLVCFSLSCSHHAPCSDCLLAVHDHMLGLGNLSTAACSQHSRKSSTCTLQDHIQGLYTAMICVHVVYNSKCGSSAWDQCAHSSDAPSWGTPSLPPLLSCGLHVTCQPQLLFLSLLAGTAGN